MINYKLEMRWRLSLRFGHCFVYSSTSFSFATRSIHANQVAHLFKMRTYCLIGWWLVETPPFLQWHVFSFTKYSTTNKPLKLCSNFQMVSEKLTYSSNFRSSALFYYQYCPTSVSKSICNLNNQNCCHTYGYLCSTNSCKNFKMILATRAISIMPKSA